MKEDAKPAFPHIHNLCISHGLKADADKLKYILLRPNANTCRGPVNFVVDCSCEIKSFIRSNKNLGDLLDPNMPLKNDVENFGLA